MELYIEAIEEGFDAAQGTAIGNEQHHAGEDSPKNSGDAVPFFLGDEVQKENEQCDQGHRGSQNRQACD